MLHCPSQAMDLGDMILLGDCEEQRLHFSFLVVPRLRSENGLAQVLRNFGATSGARDLSRI